MESLSTEKPRDWGSLILVAMGVGLGWSICWSTGCWLSSLAETRIAAHLPGEAALPFVWAALPIYLSQDLAMFVVWLAYRSGRDLMPLAVVLILQSAIAAACFAIFPLESAFATRPEGVWADIFGLVGLPDLSDFGYAPSLHASFAITVAAALEPRWRGRGGAWRWVRAALWPWAWLVTVSTVLVHEHLAVDAVTGAALGLACIPLLRSLERRWA